MWGWRKPKRGGGVVRSTVPWSSYGHHGWGTGEEKCLIVIRSEQGKVNVQREGGAAGRERDNVEVIRLSEMHFA